MRIAVPFAGKESGWRRCLWGRGLRMCGSRVAGCGGVGWSFRAGEGGCAWQVLSKTDSEKPRADLAIETEPYWE